MGCQNLEGQSQGGLGALPHKEAWQEVGALQTKSARGNLGTAGSGRGDPCRRRACRAGALSPGLPAWKGRKTLRLTHWMVCADFLLRKRSGFQGTEGGANTD